MKHHTSAFAPGGRRATVRIGLTGNRVKLGQSLRRRVRCASARLSADAISGQVPAGRPSAVLGPSESAKPTNGEANQGHDRKRALPSAAPSFDGPISRLICPTTTWLNAKPFFP